MRDVMPMNCRAMGRRIELPKALTADIDRIFSIWEDCRQRYASDSGWLFGDFGVDGYYFTTGLAIGCSCLERPPGGLLQGGGAMQDVV